MFLTPLFKLMEEKQASDLFFTAGAPIQIKINGIAMPVNTQVLDGAAVKRIAYEMMTEEQITRVRGRRMEMNFSLSRAPTSATSGSTSSGSAARSAW